MAESDQVEFHETVQPRGGRSLPVRIGIVVGAATLFVVGAVAAMGASPTPSAATDPSSSATPAGPNGGMWGGMRGGFGMHGDFGMPGGFRDITISAISGSSITLKTDDGWTRTIAVTSTTTITKGGQAIAVGDLAVGDQVRFSEDRATDGTYTITAISVVLPTVFGEVTAVDGSTITVTEPGGTTATIHVTGDTTYAVDGSATAALSDVKVGSFIVAEGNQRADGSLDAARVQSGFGGHDGWGGHDGPGFPDDPDHQVDPNATPAPSTNAG